MKSNTGGSIFCSFFSSSSPSPVKSNTGGSIFCSFSSSSSLSPVKSNTGGSIFSSFFSSSWDSAVTSGEESVFSSAGESSTGGLPEKKSNTEGLGVADEVSGS